jgi:hypothetical protein
MVMLRMVVLRLGMLQMAVVLRWQRPMAVMLRVGMVMAVVLWWQHLMHRNRWKVLLASLLGAFARDCRRQRAMSSLLPCAELPMSP